MSTPATLPMAFSVRATQLAQVMPVMGSSMVVSWSLTVLQTMVQAESSALPRRSVPTLKRWYPLGYLGATGAASI